MNLDSICRRAATPTPWAEGDNIPWHDPDFSRRMLAEHLSQAHDLASRRQDTIDRHVDWIHKSLLSTRPTRILDLGCGPGFYTARLARLGHACVGVDYSPAAIAHAAQNADDDASRACEYIHGDIRTADYGGPFGLVMLLYGEFNVFRPDDARQILKKAHAALEPGGRLLLEAHTAAAIEALGRHSPAWESAQSGLFSDRPHITLSEKCWDETRKAATTRYYVIDAASGAVSRHAASYQRYTNQEYVAILTACGFSNVEFTPSLTGGTDDSQSDLIAIVASHEHAARHD